MWYTCGSGTSALLTNIYRSDADMNITRSSYFVGTCLALSLGVMPHAEAAEQPYQVEWIAQIGSSDSEYTRAVAVDTAGNIFISGYTYGSLGGINAGKADAFLTKFSPSGNALWSAQIGTITQDLSHSVAVDAAGNAYISGWTSGSLGGPTWTKANAFVTKFDPSGIELWTTQISTPTLDYSNSVAVDALGNTYISGYTEGSLGGNNLGGWDAFLTKVDPSGTPLWTKQIGTASDDRSWSVAVDKAGNSYISGDTNGSLEGTNAGAYDAFLIKFDPSGTELWTRQIGSSGNDPSQSVAVDATGNVFISGFTSGNLGGPSAGSEDAYLTKFDPSGNELWSAQIGSLAADRSYSVAVDGMGNAYIGGYSHGDLAGPSAGYDDAFLAKFSPLGDHLRSAQIGMSSNDSSGSVAVDAAGNAYMAGQTWGNLGGPNAGSADAFLIKFTIPEPTSVALLTVGFATLLRRR
jgi:hypothetical protein